MTSPRVGTYVLAAFAALSFLSGCGGSSAPLISVTVSPATATMAGGANQTFTATVANDTINAGVTWTASTGTITSAGVYTAPAVITATSATVTAASKTDATKAATATITFTPIGVTVSPTTATLIGGASQTFTATVTADLINAGVTWTASTGTITSAGVYTAPAVITTTSATVTATSKTDTTKSAVANITLTPISLTAVNPATASMGSGGSQIFTDSAANDASNSGVTWSIGSGVGTLTANTITSVTYNAPKTAITAVTAVTLTATSIKDPTKSTTAAITLNPVSVAIAPSTPAAMIGGATQALTATVANDASNAGVTWSVTGGGSFSAVTTASGIATTFTSANPVAATSAVVTATSVKDPTKSASLTITLTPIAVSFSTVTSGITLDSGQTLALAAAVANDSSASGATFKVTGAGTLNPATATGNTPSTTLTATGTVASTVTVTATSIKDPSRSVTTATMTVNPAPAIITPSGALAPGTTNTVYAGATIAASGGTGVKAFSINSGTLPSGLTINGSTGVISGTPTGTAGTSTFTVKVTDSATTPVSVSSGSYSIIISAAPLVWVSPAAATNTYTVGTAITPISLTTSGGTGAIAYSLHTGTLPAGLSIAGNILSGTPTAPTVVAGNVVNFLATDSATTPVTAVSANLTLIVNPVALVITSASLPTGTVNAPYSYQLTSTGGVGTITWSLSAGSLTGTGLALSGSGLLSGTPTASQSSLSLTFQAKDSATNQQQTVTKVLPLTVSNALTVTSNSTLANATVNVAYSQTLAAAGGSGSGYTWTVTSGATGTNSLATLNLSLSSAGVLTGTPATTGTANFTAQVKDSANHTATATFTVTAYAALSLPAPNPTSLGTAVVNQSYTGSITATGGIPGYNWTINGAALGGSPIGLGNGLSASSNGALLSITGTPTTTSTVSFTAKITDSASSSAGPLTYTIAVSATSTVSGNISLLNNCGGVAVPSITLSINTTPVQTTTTTSGTYSFANIPNGTYTITPSIAGPSSVFYPATQSVTVSGSPVTAAVINAALGYTVSGSVAYAGSKTGQIYLSLNSTTCGGGGSQGTSISSAGAYTIRGVPPGAYTLQAFMDNLGYGLTNTSNPVGNSSVTVSTANFTSANVTLADPATVTLSQGPSLKGVSPFNNGAGVNFRGIKDSNGVEAATSYTLQWSITSTFTTIAGSQTFPAVGNHSNVWLLNSTKNPSLTNGSVYYFRAYGSSAGTPISPYSPTVGPVTIGPSTGAATVSGSVAFTGTATGPLYTGFYDQNTGIIYAEYIATPVSAQAFTVQLPIGSNYVFFGIIDQNNDGAVDAGDIQNVNSNSSPTIITGNTTNENLTLPGGASTATVATQAYKFTNSSSTSQSYGLHLSVSGMVKLPVSVTLAPSTNADGANVISPTDVALCGGIGSTCGRGFQIISTLGPVSPSVGDVYTFNVNYSDATTGTLTATVSAVLNAFATNLAPNCTSGCTSTSTTPIFTWTDPTNASAYTYQFYINGPTGTIWQVPGNNSNTNGLTSATTSLVWATDPTNSSNMPTVPSLTTGTNYQWQITVNDTNNNQATQQVTYQP